MDLSGLENKWRQSCTNSQRKAPEDHAVIFVGRVSPGTLESVSTLVSPVTWGIVNEWQSKDLSSIIHTVIALLLVITIL